MFSSSPMEILGSLGSVSIVVLLILLLFSVSSWGIIVYKIRMFRVANQEEAQFLHAFERSRLNAKDFERLKSTGESLSLSPSAAVFVAVTQKIERHSDVLRNRDLLGGAREGRGPNRQYLEKVVQYIIQGQINDQERYLPFLATTGNISPFIGLFGTVVGVMNAFGKIGAEGSASIAAVAPGVAEALVATAAGLFAAIPAVMAYNYFLTKIRKSVFRVEAFSIEFLNVLDEFVSDEKEAEVVR